MKTKAVVKKVRQHTFSKLEKEIMVALSRKDKTSQINPEGTTRPWDIHFWLPRSYAVDLEIIKMALEGLGHDGYLQVDDKSNWTLTGKGMTAAVRFL